ncbi:MAG: divergent polysaccharide deacetylase family protein [Spirochaetia bacterium]
MAKQRSKRGRRILTAVGIAGILTLALGITLAFLPRKAAESEPKAGIRDEKAQETPGGTSEETGAEAAAAVRPTVRPKARPTVRPKARGTLYIIIDDVGNNIHQLMPFLEFPGPITFAILPGLPYTDEAIELILKSKKGLMLHQPMEPVGGEDPGPEAIYDGMAPEEVAKILEKNLEQVKGARVVNNHMGSKVTARDSTVRSILETLDSKGIAFVDSYTTSDSVVGRIAAEMEITTYRRDIFLDNRQNIEYYTKAVEDAKTTAEKKGHAVLIGHVWAADLAQTLMDLYPELVEEGFELEEISRLTGLEDS